MNGAWNNLFTGVARANLMIDVIQKAGGPTAEQTLAELRTLRAWYYYMLMDMFGGVPLVTEHQGRGEPEASARDSIFRFIESELKATRTAAAGVAAGAIRRARHAVARPTRSSRACT